MDYNPSHTEQIVPEIKYNSTLRTITVVLVSLVVGIQIGRTPASSLSIGVSHITSSTVVNLYSVQPKEGVDFTEFWQVWNTVKERYVHQPVTDRELFYGAMQGMVQGLGDPYSVYFPPKDASDFKQDLSGQFEGIGAQIGIKDKQLIVIAPLPQSPAEKAGIKNGDYIMKIDAKDTANMSLDEAVSLIRGKHGTTVTLSIFRLSDKRLQDIVVERQVISVPTVSFEMKPGSVAYVRINFFNQDTNKEFSDVVQTIIDKKVRGIILDMRSNPGGYLESAVDIASEWIVAGPIVRERDSANHEVVHATRGTHRLLGIPTVVLVDGGSASASEIVAGALQDADVATVVGQKTFGKGSVQDFMDLPDGSALKITIAKWLTPHNREINEKGIEPDLVVDPMFSSPTSTQDLGIEKALSVLSSSRL
jgi:carboxyl-terminal processing protease